VAKSPDAFRTISEVASCLGTQSHVLRFWESKFRAVSPVQRTGGRRYYRQTDITLLGGIKFLLHKKGMTIKAVQRLLQDEGAAHVQSFSSEIDIAEVSNISKKRQPKIVISNSAKLIKYLNDSNTNELEQSKSDFRSEYLEHKDQPFLFPELESEHVSTEVAATYITALELKNTNTAKPDPSHIFKEDFPKMDPNLDTFVGQIGPITAILKLSMLKKRQVARTSTHIIIQLKLLKKKLSA
jgi:DNA-binding transcriptional MerR regulator